MKPRRALGLLLAAGLLAGPRLAAAQTEAPAGPQPNTPIEHVIFLMQENHSFDNYFGTYPGADGFPEGTCVPVDPFDPGNTECIEPFHIGTLEIEDLDHSSKTFQLQYNQGRMDGFVYALHQRNQQGALALGYYDDRDLPFYWNIADEYVLFDRFFTSAGSGSFANHMYWVAGQSGSRPSQEEEASGGGYGDELQTIFDRLQARGISWKFYVQNYDPELNYRAALTGLGNRASQLVWVPLLSIDRFIDDPELAGRIVNLDEYYTDLENGSLPAVAYIVPSGASEHPPGSLRSGQRFVRSLIQALMRSPYWNSSAFMWTYDDWGGWYDHVPPPQVDAEGYGFRAPALLVSAYARRGYIDSTELDFTSMLKFIEANWNLEPLAARDARANNFLGAFDFTQPPRQPSFVPFERATSAELKQPRREYIYLTYGAALVVAVVFLGWLLLRGDPRPGPKADGDGPEVASS